MRKLTERSCWIWLILNFMRSLVKALLNANLSVGSTSLPGGRLMRTRVPFLPSERDWSVRTSSEASARVSDIGS